LALVYLMLLICGLVLGSRPILFLVYINELVFVIEQQNIKDKLFADDVIKYVRILVLMTLMYVIYSQL